MTKIFLSSALEGARMPFQHRGIKWGHAHYSWRFNVDQYSESFVCSGLDIIDILRPEIYQTNIAREHIGAKDVDVHFAVKPIEHFRPFHGLRNLVMSNWEFPEFSKSDFGISPFYNQIRMFSAADAVLCLTAFTFRNLQRFGVESAVILPPAIRRVEPSNSREIMEMPTVSLESSDISEMPTSERLGDWLASRLDDDIFLTVLNPFDHRKQLDKIVEGFVRAKSQGSNIGLVIKLIIDNERTQLGNINEILSNNGCQARSKDVVFCSAHLSDAAMAELRRQADFYLCASSAEGLNLPVIEAALDGIPIVTTLNSATGAYLSDEDVFEIPSIQQRAGRQINALGHLMPFSHFPPTVEGVCRAVLGAAAAAPDERTLRAERARAVVNREFSQDMFDSRFRDLLKKLGVS